MIEKDNPIYPVSIAAKVLNISADRLRSYEENGLIKPHREELKNEKLKGAKRLYSQNDMEWIASLRQLIKSGISIPALEILIHLLPYYQKAGMPDIEALQNNENWKYIKDLIESPNYKSLTKI